MTGKPTITLRDKRGNSSTLETQAKEVAKGRAQTLHRAPAARLPGDPGQGRRLAPAYQNRLDNLFAADLQALMVHTGPQASALADAQGARAFAAGPHLVFGAGAFRPDTNTGFALLAHEAAHAVQQTGQTDRYGTLRLVESGGQTGPLQRDDDPKTKEAEAAKLSWTDLKTAYAALTPWAGKKDLPLGKPYDADLAFIEKTIDCKVYAVTKTKHGTDAAKVLLAHRYKSLRGASLAADVLTLSLELETVVDLIRKFPKLEMIYASTIAYQQVADTVGWDELIGLFIDEKGSDYVMRHWTEMLDRVQVTARKVGGTVPKQSAIAWLIRKASEPPDVGQTRPNPMQLQVLLAIANFETQAYNIMREATTPDRMAIWLAETGAQLSASSPILRSLSRIRFLRNILKNAPPELAEVSGLFDAASLVLIPKLDRIEQSMLQGFGTFRDYFTAYAGGFVDIKRQGAGGTLVIPPPLETFLTALAGYANTDTTNGTFQLMPESVGDATGAPGTSEQQMIALMARMPKPGDFDKRRRTMVSAIRDNALELRTALSATQVPGKVFDYKRTDAISTLTFTLLWVDWFTAFADETAQWGGRDADQVAVARYNLARALYTLGQMMGHTALTLQAGVVSKATDAGFSYAVIPEWDFRQDTTSDFRKDLVKEVTTIGDTWSGYGAQTKGTPYRSEIAVPVDVLVDIYQLHYLEKAIPAMLAEVARQQVIVNANKKNPASEGIKLPPANSIQAVIDTVAETVPHPRKWVAEGGALVRNPGDKRPPFEVMLGHPAILTRRGQSSASPPAGGKGAPGIWKTELPLRSINRWNGVDLWTLPPLEPIRAKLRENAAVKFILRKWAKSRKWQEPTEPLAWLLQLYDYAKENGGLWMLRTSLRLGTDFDLMIKQTELNAALRKMSTLNRGIHVDYVRDRLAPSSDETGIKGSRDIAFDPKLVGQINDSITSFSASVRPKTDQDIQTVALMIEIAPQLLATVKSRTSYDHVRSFFEPAALALSMATGSIVFGVKGEGAGGEDGGVPTTAATQAFATRMRGLGIDDAALTQGIKNLQEILTVLDTARRKSQALFKLNGSRKDGLKTNLADKWLDPNNKDDSMFVLALPVAEDVHSGGDWAAPVPPKPNPLDQATQGGSDTTSVAPKVTPLWMRNIIVGTQNPVYYELLDVYHDFTYMPAYMPGRAAGRDAELRDGKGNLIPDSAKTPLLRFRFSYMTKQDGEISFAPAREVIVCAGDHELLELMNSVVDHQGRLVKLRNLANTIQFAGELFLDLLEFVPGFGQALMIARLAASVIEMITKLEWDEIRTDLVTEPQKILKFLETDLLGNLETPDMFSFFLASLMKGHGASVKIQGALDRAEAKSEARRAKAKTANLTGKKKKSLKYRQLMDSVSAIAIDVGQAFFRAKQKMGIGAKSAAARVATAPKLTKHIDRLPLYLAYANMLEGFVYAGKNLGNMLAEVSELTPEAARNARADAQADFKGGGAGAFSGAINAMMEPLTSFELPHEVIPLDLAVQIILDMTIGRVRNKKIKIVYEALRLTGGLQKISSLVAKNLFKDSPINPNVYWRDEVAGMIAPKITDGRDRLITELFAMMTTLFPGAGLIAPTPKPIVAEWSDATLRQDIEAYGFGRGFPSLVHPMTAIPQASGFPLAAELRADLERGFGYDLGHLRLHNGPAAHDFVSSIGAEAAASGGHIYLGSGLDTDTAHGGHVLRHEVAHALQQTRPSAVGTGGRIAPEQPGRGRGVRLDAKREDGAERMARAAHRRDSVEDGPMRIEGIGPMAIMPYSRTDLVGLVSSLGEEADPRNFGQAKFGQNLLTGVHKKERTAVKALSTSLKAKVASATKAPGMDYGTSSASQAKIIDELTKIINQIDENKMLRIASSAVYTLSDSQKKKLKRDIGVDFAKLIEILEGVIFAESGIMVELRHNKATPEQITAITFYGINFGGVRGNTALYDYIKSQTGKKVGTHDFSFARTFLRGQFPQPHDWVAGGGLKLSANGIRRRTTDIKRDELPTWAKYVKHDDSTQKQSLRVGTHETLTGPGGADGRDSHHLPQYLLVEFYRGRSKTPGISIWGQNGNYWTPGFSGPGIAATKRPNGKRIYDEFKSSGFSFNFKDLDKSDSDNKRGSGMPAISISRVTHQTGNLHLTPKATWSKSDEANAPGTQGLAMLAHYNKSVARGVKAKQNIKKTGLTATGGLDSGEGFREMVNDALNRATRTANADESALNDLHDVTADAMKSSYRMFVGVMAPQLRRQLASTEVEVYREVARDENFGFSVTDDVENFPAGYVADKDKPGKWIDDVMGALRDLNATKYKGLYNASAW